MRASISSFVLCAVAASAQSVCNGNGVGSAFLRTSYAALGGSFVAEFGSPAAPGGLSIVGVGESRGPILFPHPLIGNVCMDMLNPGYQTLLFVLDAQGRGRLQTSIPNVPALLQYAGFYLHDITVEGALANPTISITRTDRVTAEQPDSWRVIGGMQLGRSLHSATALQRSATDARTRVLIAGGDGGNFMQPVATATTELYDPLLRAFVAGPAMLTPRGGHTATRLADGRVLLAGGTGTAGVVTAACEIYDPVANTFAAVASMGVARTAHRASLLPDGRVLVTGGLLDWTQATTQFVNRLNTAMNTTEIWDPVANTWTPGPAMADRRAAHVQITLPDQRILLVSGINGGVSTHLGSGTAEVPTYTPTCEIFDPAAGTFAPTGNVVAPCAFAAASLLANGAVLVTGGIVADNANYNAAIASAGTQQWSGGAWSIQGALRSTHAFHTQITLPDGTVFVAGGMVGDLTALAGSAEALLRTATGGWTPVAAIGAHAQLGTNPSPRGNLTATPLADGSILVVGGSHLLTAAADAAIWYR